MLEYEVEEDRTADRTRSILVNAQEPPAGSPDWNMAPSKQAPVVLTRVPRRGGGDAAGGDALTVHPVRQLRLLTWGLVPSWAKDPKVGARMANARAESVLSKPSFARAAAVRRCLVPAEGWYEWQMSPSATDARGKPRKQPFHVRRADGEPLAMAGLYEFWRDPVVESPEDPAAWLVTFTIITTSADPGLDRLHDRQPLVLDREDWARWLDPGTQDARQVEDLLGAHRPGRFEAYPVSTAVNATRNNGPELVEPAPAETLEGVVDPMTGEVLGRG